MDKNNVSGNYESNNDVLTDTNFFLSISSSNVCEFVLYLCSAVIISAVDF